MRCQKPQFLKKRPNDPGLRTHGNGRLTEKTASVNFVKFGSHKTAVNRIPNAFRRLCGFYLNQVSKTMIRKYGTG